jgi:cytochrome P450
MAQTSPQMRLETVELPHLSLSLGDAVQFQAPDFMMLGGGVHHCLGHFIARADMTEALKVLPRRIRNPRLDGEPAFLPDSGNTGAVRLPIAFDAEG